MSSFSVHLLKATIKLLPIEPHLMSLHAHAKVIKEVRELMLVENLSLLLLMCAASPLNKILSGS